MRNDLYEQSWLMERTPSLLAQNMFYYIQSAGHYYYKKEAETERTGYDSILLAYVISGKGKLKYKDEAYFVHPGQLFIIDCMDYQYYAPDKCDLWEIKYIHFNGCESRKYVCRILENGGPLCHIKSGLIPDCLSEIHQLIKLNDVFIDIKASKLIVEILTELLITSITGSNSNPLIPDTIKKALNIIISRYNESVTIDSISKTIGLSKYYMNRLFKKHTGYSPYEYITKYRLGQSKKLLKTTSLTVSEISETVGYESVSQFCKLFKQYEGMSPMKFREYK